MKSIPFRIAGIFKTAEIIKTAVTGAASGINVPQMRARIRVLDALDGNEGDELLLEDADHQTLCEAVNAISWAVADRDLLSMIDDILNAKSPAST